MDACTSVNNHFPIVNMGSEGRALSIVKPASVMTAWLLDLENEASLGCSDWKEEQQDIMRSGTK